MRIAICYTSVTHNTLELAHDLKKAFEQEHMTVDCYSINDISPHELVQYDVLIIGTYSWSGGTIPAEMLALYDEIEETAPTHLVTGVFGTGDRFFPYFCGAVDEFRDMLYVKTNLAVTLKVELSPQQQDRNKYHLFVNKVRDKLVNQPISI